MNLSSAPDTCDAPLPRWAQWLAGRGAYVAVMGIAAVLALPTYVTGFFLDDYAHLKAIDGRNPVAGPWNLYVFAPGASAEQARLIEDGPFPWFTDPDLRVEFFRPLASLTMRLDHLLFGNAAWAYHLHCVLWYLLLLWVVGGILRRALPGTTGALAFLLFAVDEAHWFPVAWWSHRQAFVAAVFGFAALSAHLRWRENGWRHGMPLSLVTLALGLLSSELALTILGYFLAYELLAGPGKFPERARALMPAFTLGIVYVAGYVLSGFGAHAGDCYLDPVHRPLAFLSKAPARFLVLAATQFLSWPAEFPAFVRAAVVPSAALGAAALAAVVFALRACWPRLAPGVRKGAAWLAAGGLLALPPYLSPFTSSRLLLVCSLGGAAVIAVVIHEAWRQRRCPALGRLLVAVHLIAGAAAWLVLSPAFAWLNTRIETVVEQAELDDTRISGQQCMLVSPADPALCLYTPAMRGERGHPEPAAWRPLSFAPYDHAVTRTAENAFELEVLDGEMFGTMPESVARSVEDQFAEGTVLRFPEFDVTVLERGRYGVKRIGFLFRRSLEDGRYVWLAWKDGGLRRFAMPAMGERMVLKWRRIV